MIWYIVILTIVLIAGLVQREAAFHYKDIANGIMMVLCAVLFLFAAMRGSSVGADTSNYEKLFDWVSQCDFSQLANLSTGFWYVDNSDILFRYYCKVLSLFFSSGRAVTVANSFIVAVALFFLIKQQSRDFWLSVFLFVTLGFYQLSMNLAPFFMAILVVMCGFQYVCARKLLPYLFFVALGSFLHPAVIFMALMYPVVLIRLNQKRFLMIFSLGVFVSVFAYPQMISVLLHIVPTRYQPYLAAEGMTSDKIIVWVTHLVIFFMCWIAQKDRAAMFEQHGFFVWVFLVESLVYLWSMQSSGANRIAFMFSPYFIIVVPQLLSSVRNHVSQTVGGEKMASSSLTLHASRCKALIVVFCVVQYLGRMCVNNIGQTIPYTFL